jgi:LysM repeat protein
VTATKFGEIRLSVPWDRVIYLLLFTDMAANEKSGEEKQALGPSVVLGLVGAVVVLVLLGAGIWGVSKIVSKVRESSDDEESETVAEEESEDGEEEDEGENEESEDGNGEEESDEGEDTQAEESEESDEENQEEESQEEENSEEESSEEESSSSAMGKWVANNYVEGDIGGDKYTVVRGDTLWEIAEARYGSGFEWKKIREANEDTVGYHESIGWAVIVPGQVLTLPE